MPVRLLILLLLAGPMVAAEPSPREQVLRLVPPGSSVCFVVQNLRSHSEAVAKSPFAEWATEKIAGALEGNDDAKKLKALESFVAAALGVTLKDLRDDILGDCFAFAYEPGPAGQPDLERSTVLLYARDPKKLQKLLDALNKLQKQTGDLTELSEHQHAGVKYIKRHRNAEAGEFYVLHDHLFAYTMDESGLKAAIDRMQKPGDSQVLNDLAAMKLQDAFLACWLAPRKLDADLQAPANANEAEKASRAAMAKLWSAVDRCALYLQVDGELELGAAVHYRANDVPAEWKAVFDGAPKPSALWSAVPAGAIAALAVDVEALPLLDAIASFLPEMDRPKLRKMVESELAAIVGKPNVAKLLADIGPELGVWIERTPKDGPVLPNCTAAVRVRNSSGHLLLRAVRFYAQLMIVDYNRRHDDTIALNNTKIDNLEIEYLANDRLFPQGTKPAFALSQSYLVLGSNPETVAAFKAPAGPPMAGDVPILRINAAALRSHLLDHKDGLAAFLETLQDRDESEIAKDIDNLSKVLEAVEKVELVVRGDTGRRVFALKAKLVKALK
jgi:hypothetical protein